MQLPAQLQQSSRGAQRSSTAWTLPAGPSAHAQGQKMDNFHLAVENASIHTLDVGRYGHRCAPQHTALPSGVLTAAAVMYLWYAEYHK